MQTANEKEGRKRPATSRLRMMQRGCLRPPSTYQLRHCSHSQLQQFRRQSQFAFAASHLTSRCVALIVQIIFVSKEVQSLGLDIAAPQIEYARPRYGGRNKEFLEQSVPQTSFPAQSFDTISCIEVIEHLPSSLRYSRGVFLTAFGVWTGS
jgi:hypothetical protein